MPAIKLTRRYRFSSSHRLHSPALSEDENRRVYGKCNNPYGHGHDYLLEVTVEGEPDPVTGRMFPLALLDALVGRVVLEPMDRRDLNAEIDEFASLVPTTENLAAAVARRIADAWPHFLPGAAARLDKIRIHETKNNIFQIRATDPAVRPPAVEAEQRQRVTK
ncbi:MAG: 6-carboxytetrahydropterin synthase [Bryobacteraceae bacterium]|nr:6-carboxytetrahydropterin synthase [Bryobacteraceae bacterium]